MAVQSTMTNIGRTNDIYVTKTAFYWSIGIIILLLTAVTLSMARDITRLTGTEQSSEARPAAVQPPPPQQPEDFSAELPPVPQ